MENASEALLMAGRFLLFILALTVCITSFTTLRVGIDGMMNEPENIKLAKDSDLYINYIESRDDGATRIVGAETVVSSMYRAIKENFTMYIIFNDTTILGNVEHNLANLKDENGNKIPGIELKRDEDAKNRLKITISNDANYRSNSILANGLYKEIEGIKFEEFLGEYQEASDSAVSSENKSVKRIITYQQH